MHHCNYSKGKRKVVVPCHRKSLNKEQKFSRIGLPSEVLQRSSLYIVDWPLLSTFRVII